MFSILTKRISTGISVLKQFPMINFGKFASGGNCKSPDQLPCNRKEKPRRPFCKINEPSCPVSLTKRPSFQEDPCKERPKCCGSKRLARDPCNCMGARQDKKKNFKLDRRVREFKVSAWEYTGDCCGNPCPEMIPRFDTLYYVATDKAKRQYQQTWVECPPFVIKKRKVCCYDPTELPPLCKRQKAQCPMTASEFDSQKLKFLCKVGSHKNCPHIQAPNCYRGRYPPKCHIRRGLSGCRKRCCPYPSFSECCHECLNPPKNMECLCATTSPTCVAYRYLKRKILYNLPPPLPAWPPKML